MEEQFSRRYEVHVSYPNFGEDGSPYFDQSSVQDYLVMTKEEIKNHKWQEQKGYLKIHSIKPLIPESGNR